MNSTSPSSAPAPRFRDDIRRGEIYWVDWSPGRGSEQTGRRPALIIQNDQANANGNYGLTLVATVSTHGKAVPTHVEVQPSPENGLRAVSYIKCEQLMTIEKARLEHRIGTLSSADMDRVVVALKISQGMR